MTPLPLALLKVKFNASSQTQKRGRRSVFCSHKGLVSQFNQKEGIKNDKRRFKKRVWVVSTCRVELMFSPDQLTSSTEHRRPRIIPSVSVLLSRESREHVLKTNNNTIQQVTDWIVATVCTVKMTDGLSCKQHKRKHVDASVFILWRISLKEKDEKRFWKTTITIKRHSITRKELLEGDRRVKQTVWED